MNSTSPNSVVADAAAAGSDANHAAWFIREVQPHDRSLRAYLRKSLPCRADADDIAQETYFRLLRAKARDRIRATKPLLFAIARNAVRDFFFLRSRTEHVEITETAILPVLHEEQGTIESLCHAQELALLTEAIHALPERQREVILLRKIKGCSQKEIARLLGIAEHTVENLAVKGARRCADFLRAHGVTSSHDSPR
ncbi:MAG TPA: sigma-70 family RNA polymerase sigma factor [Opitutaceae bacterium]|nr:sigma-70 family RNA polymerase sigma factor [Opitutaceae bacterium]